MKAFEEYFVDDLLYLYVRFKGVDELTEAPFVWIFIRSGVN